MAHSQPTPSETRARILVADDEPALRALLSEELGKLGYRVRQAANGQETLDQVRVERPDLLLLDLKMPELSGIGVCRHLRAEQSTRDLPIIVVTGLDAREALEESIIAGADDFLTKPIDFLELSVRVRSLLRVRNIHDEEQRLEGYVRNLQSLRGQAGS